MIYVLIMNMNAPIMMKKNEFYWTYFSNMIYDYMDLLESCSNSFYWNDLDPNYPNNTYHYGFSYNNYVFDWGYSGCAGHYFDTIIHGCGYLEQMKGA